MTRRNVKHVVTGHEPHPIIPGHYIPVTRPETMLERQTRHWQAQRKLGHWRPAIVAGKLESPRPASSYRGARRNALRRRELTTADVARAA